MGFMIYSHGGKTVFRGKREDFTKLQANIWRTFCEKYVVNSENPLLDYFENEEKELKPVMDFLRDRSNAGSVRSKTCRKIYEIIKDKDFGDENICYEEYANNDYERFKEFLRDCAERRASMRWW